MLHQYKITHNFGSLHMSLTILLGLREGWIASCHHCDWYSVPNEIMQKEDA